MTDAHSKIWPLWKFTVVFYPFAATAAAINIFMVFLLLQVFGVVAISPVVALVIGLVTGPYFSWLAAKWIRGLIIDAERAPS